MPDLLSCREKLINVDKDFMDDVREVLKHDEDAVTNNCFFDDEGSKKNPARCMKNLQRKNDLDYFTYTRLYIHGEN